MVQSRSNPCQGIQIYMTDRRLLVTSHLLFDEPDQTNAHSAAFQNDIFMKLFWYFLSGVVDDIAQKPRLCFPYENS